MLTGVVVYRLVGPAMHAQIALLVTGQAQDAAKNRSVHTTSTRPRTLPVLTWSYRPRLRFNSLSSKITWLDAWR